jgi:hypothetical protein
VCLCARALHSGEEVEVFFDRRWENPFDYDAALFVGFKTPAEWKTFLALSWNLPPNILDLRFEYFRLINGIWRNGVNLRNLGAELLDAMAEFNLHAMSCADKDEERDYILAHDSYPHEGQRRILDHGWRDGDGSSLLLGAMLPLIDEPASSPLHVP